MKALLRRTEKEDDGDTLACGSIEIDNKRHSVTVQGETCELTFKEFELLKYLMINQGIVLSRDKLMNQVWGRRKPYCRYAHKDAPAQAWRWRTTD